MRIDLWNDMGDVDFGGIFYQGAHAEGTSMNSVGQGTAQDKLFDLTGPVLTIFGCGQAASNDNLHPQNKSCLS